MAQFLNMYSVDLQKPTGPKPLRQTVCEGDNAANRIGAIVTSDGESVSLGGSCVGKVVRADGTTVQLSGTISGNQAYVVLDQASCAVVGQIQVAVCWVSGSNVTTLVVAYGSVVKTQTGNAIQPSTPIPDLTQLLAEIDEMRAATAAATAAASGALNNFAGAFDETAVYTAGQYITYTDGKFYRLTADHAANATWANTNKVAVTTGGELSDLKSALTYTNVNLPWYQTYLTSLFSHGQVLYGTGVWSDTITRWGTKDLQYADEDIHLSIKAYEPELIYHVCFFDQSGTYTSWSGWQNKNSGEYTIPAGSYYKITIARRSDSSDAATIDYIYQLVKNTGLKQTAEDTSAVIASKFKWVNSGIRFDPILVGGYTSQSTIRSSVSLDIRRRYKTMLKPKFIYAGSYVYCDTARLYRMGIVKRETPESENGTVISDNIPIPTQDAPYVFPEDGYYSIHFMAYDGSSEVVLEELYSHITFGLYSDAPNSIVIDFIGSGRTFQGPADATLFIGEHGKTLLIDGAYQHMQGNLINEIHNMGIDHLDYVMVSHYHNDHFAGLTILYEDNDLSPNNTTFILPSEEGVAYALEHLSSDMNVDWYNRFMAVLNNADCIITHPTNNDVMNIGGMMIRFWNADHSIYEGVSTNYNDWSLCCYVTYGTQRICMTGDLGPIGERLNQGKMLKSNIYKAHHHGWDGTSAATDVMGMKRYMSEIMPDIIVALDGGAHDNLYLQDTSPLIPWCEDNAVPLYRAHEWSPIKIEVAKDSFSLLTTARRYMRAEVAT